MRWPSGEAQFPTQTWPVADGRFKILAMLSPGPNHLIIRPEKKGITISSHVERELELIYLPLGVPPLHLAIMVGKDSPLLIDCPPAKHGGVSSAHASLDAAIAKFRMTAYMWQALTAEDMRMKGMGRRSFRLDEEWTADTTSSSFLDASSHEGGSSDLFAAAGDGGAMRATAKIHLIPSLHTVAEIRDTNVAQQNAQAQHRDSLHAMFAAAIKAYSTTHPSLARSARPVVAGLILDAHYSPRHDMILGHAALGAHDPRGLSLGVMGSHLAYAWPRFLEEVTSCLLDARAPGGDGAVGNDNGECGTLWEACAVGQGAFLHEAGHALGAPHTTGIMARGYPVHWPRNFVARTAWCARDREEGMLVGDDETENDARWDLRDALRFSVLPHFWMPADGGARMSAEARTAGLVVTAAVAGDDDAEETGDEKSLSISSSAGIARVQWNDLPPETTPSVSSPVETLVLGDKALEARFSRAAPLRLQVIAMNGKELDVRDAWRLLSSESVVRIPGASFCLQRRSVSATSRINGTEDDDDDDHEQGQTFWNWATLLRRRKSDGSLARACKVDVRTGCVLDGAYVYYDDGTRVNCGPRFERDSSRRRKHRFGGHASEEIDMPAGVEIVKIEVGREEGRILSGLRIHLSDGTSGGQLSGNDGPPDGVFSLGEYLTYLLLFISFLASPS